MCNKVMTIDATPQTTYPLSLKSTAQQSDPIKISSKVFVTSASITHIQTSFTAILAVHLQLSVGWLVEQGLTSHSTQFRSFRRRCFYRSDDPTNSVKALKEGG